MSEIKGVKRDQKMPSSKMMKIIFSFECVWTQPSPGYSSENETCYIKYEFEFEFEFWCLTPLSAIFQLYHGDQF